MKEWEHPLWKKVTDITHAILAPFIQHITLTGDLARDVPTFLISNGCPRTAAHSSDVANEAARVAAYVHADVALATQAGWLHDVSAVFPVAVRIQVAHALSLPVLPEEDAFPLIVHQKLSVVLAREVFGIEQTTVLSAIGCHTTLKAGASVLDKVLFVADKLAWDQDSVPPYRDALLAALEQSLDAAALCYLRYLWERRSTLRVIHPWMRAAYVELEEHFRISRRR